MNRRGFFATLGAVLAGTYFNPLAGHAGPTFETFARADTGPLTIPPERTWVGSLGCVHFYTSDNVPQGVILVGPTVTGIYPAKSCIITGIADDK